MSSPQRLEGCCGLEACGEGRGKGGSVQFGPELHRPRASSSRLLVRQVPRRASPSQLPSQNGAHLGQRGLKVVPDQPIQGCQVHVRWAGPTANAAEVHHPTWAAPRRHGPRHQGLQPQAQQGAEGKGSGKDLDAASSSGSVLPR